MNVDRELVPELQVRNLLMNALPGNHSERGIKKFGQNLTNQDGWCSCVQVPVIDVDRVDTMDFYNMVREGDGTDALAWYCSYHSYPEGKWGIFILDAGVHYLAMKIFGLQTKLSAGSLMESHGDFKSIDNSFRVLFFHEYFHFLTDVASSVLEIASGSPARPLYSDYMRRVYGNKTGSAEEPLEEALANAYAFNRFASNRWSVAHRQQLRIFMKNQPNGYGAFAKYIDSGFNNGLRNLGASIADSTPRTAGSTPLEVLFVASGDIVSSWDVPVYVVSSAKPGNEQVEIPIPGRSERDMNEGGVGWNRKRGYEAIAIPPIPEVPLPEPTALDRIQDEIDAIEKEIGAWEEANRDFNTSRVDVARMLGMGQRYEGLLETRDELMWAEKEQRLISGGKRQ